MNMAGSGVVVSFIVARETAAPVRLASRYTWRLWPALKTGVVVACILGICYGIAYVFDSRVSFALWLVLFWLLMYSGAIAAAAGLRPSTAIGASVKFAVSKWGILVSPMPVFLVFPLILTHAFTDVWATVMNVGHCLFIGMVAWDNFGLVE